MDKVWQWIKIIGYWLTIVRPVIDILKGAWTGISDEIQKIKDETEGDN